MTEDSPTLRPFDTGDFATLASWFGSEREVVLWGGPALTWPLDAGQLAPMLAETRTDPPGRLAWMAEREGVAVGHVQLGLDWRHGNALVSRVGIAPAARGQGLARAMLAPVIAQAFALPGFERVELNVYSFNAAAIRTYERLGFRREGLRRSSARVGGERWDTLGMGLLRAEWTER